MDSNLNTSQTTTSYSIALSTIELRNLLSQDLLYNEDNQENSTQPSVVPEITTSSTEALRNVMNCNTEQLDPQGSSSQEIFQPDDFLNDLEVIENPYNSNTGCESIPENNSTKNNLEIKSNIQEIVVSDTASIASNENYIDIELINILHLIDPQNSEFLYPLFVNYNIQNFQIQYLKPSHLLLIFPKDQVGILAEFEFKLERWKSTLTPDKTTATVNTISKMNATLLEIISVNKNLVSKFNKSQLTPTEVTNMLNIIKDYYVNQCGNSMRVSDMERLANEIALAYPGEFADTYFIRNLIPQPDGNYKTKISGRLVFKWTNRNERENTKKKQLLEKNNLNKTEKINILNIQNQESQERIQASLKASSGKKPLDMIMKDWANSREIRLKYIVENQNDPVNITKEWPAFLWPEGNILVCKNILNYTLITNIFLDVR